VSVRIRVFDSRIHAMSLPGGDIYEWTAKIGREVERAGEVFAPLPKKDWGPGHIPGRLKASHSHTVGTNALGVFVNVSNNAPYARYVHEGTRTPIRPRRWDYMKFTINGKTYRRQEVRGQGSNPWLWRAMMAVAKFHGF